MPKPRPRRKNQPVREGLRGFADAKKPAVDLLRDIRTWLVAEEARHGNDHRSKDKIHVSELTKADSCHRRLFYKISGVPEVDPGESVSSQLIMIWSAGTAEHEKWQGWLRDMGDLFGTWVCLQCDHTFEATSPPACEKCGGTLLRYDEVNMEDPAYPVIGHADGAVPRLNALVEIKTFSVGSVRVENPSSLKDHTYKVDGKTLIDQEGLWKSIKRPLRSHMIQGMLYLWMAERMGLPYDRIIFIYENKNNQSTKTFEVRLAERHIKRQIEWLAEIEQAIYSGVAPDRPEDFALDAKPCKYCPFRTKCWGEDGDADEGTTATAEVSPGRQVAGGEAVGGGTEVQPARPSRRRDPGGAGRHHGTRGPRTHQPDDADDPVGGAPRRSVGARRGRRAVGGGSDGESPRPRFARRKRQGRDSD